MIEYFFFIARFKFWKILYILLYKIKRLRLYIDDRALQVALAYMKRRFSSIINRYKNMPWNDDEIGKNVWFFWYTGIETAPPIVRKCYERLKNIDGIDLHLIDKNNLYEYVSFSPAIRTGFEKGYISIQSMSDVLRLNLINKYGGFWVDATVYIIDKNFFKKYEHLSFYSVKHKEKKACEHFSKGRMSSFLNASCPSGILFSFLVDIYDDYLSQHKKTFDYFFTDYAICLGYETIPCIREKINELPFNNEDVFALWHVANNEYRVEEWNYIMQHNEIQKIPWKLDNTKGTKTSMLDHFLEFSNM